MMMVETGDLTSLGVLAKASARIAEGEVFQLERTGKVDTTRAEYDEVIRSKTATLFEAACEVGAMSGGADGRGREALRVYGHELGCAFQLVDDVLDYRGESGAMGKNSGDDLREGKMTLPIIIALEHADAAERETITSALGRAETSEATLRRVVSVLDRHGALERTLEEAEDHARLAREALRPLPASDLRTLLGDVAAFTVSRAY
jgi:octaprenyl-diphosphate synthase